MPTINVRISAPGLVVTSPVNAPIAASISNVLINVDVDAAIVFPPSIPIPLLNYLLSGYFGEDYLVVYA